MLGKKEVEEIKKVSLSAETIKRRIDDISSDILETLINKLKASGYFFLHIDETTDITKKAQLLSIVRFVDGNSLREECLFCEELPERTTGREIFRVTHEFFTAMVSIGITVSTFAQMVLQLWWEKEEVLLHW